MTRCSIAEPYFYISAYFEAHKDEYINRLRAVAAADGWGEWIGLFLAATAGQARLNLDKAEQS